MRYFGAGALMLMAIALSGCSFFVRPVSIDVSKAFDSQTERYYAVINFVDDRLIGQQKNADQNYYYKKDFSSPDSKLMTEEFERELLGQGCRMVERARVDSILKEIETQYKNIADPDAMAKIGKMTSANVLIFGHLREYKEPEYITVGEKKKAVKCNRISFYVKAVDVESAKILWAGSLNRESGWLSGTYTSCDCDMQDFVMKTVQEMAKKIRKGIDANLQSAAK